MKPDKHLTRHVGVIYPDLQSLFAAGELVQELIEHPGWDHVQRLIAYEVETIEADLDLRDTPLTQAEYALKHGRRGGLRTLEGAAEAILSKSAQAFAEQRAKYESDAEPSLGRT